MGITDDNLVGSYFMIGNLNAERYERVIGEEIRFTRTKSVSPFTVSLCVNDWTITFTDVNCQKRTYSLAGQEPRPDPRDFRLES